MKFCNNFLNKFKFKIKLSHQNVFWIKHLTINFISFISLAGFFIGISFLKIFKDSEQSKINFWLLISKDYYYLVCLIVFFVILFTITAFFYNFLAFWVFFFNITFFLTGIIFNNYFGTPKHYLILNGMLFLFIIFNFFLQLKIINLFNFYLSRHIRTHKLIWNDFYKFLSLIKPYFVILFIGYVFYLLPFFFVKDQFFVIFSIFNEVGRLIILFTFLSLVWSLFLWILFLYFFVFPTKEKNHFFIFIHKYSQRMFKLLPSKEKLKDERKIFKGSLCKLFLPFIFFFKLWSWRVKRFFRPHHFSKFSFFFRYRFWCLFTGITAFLLMIFFGYPYINDGKKIIDVLLTNEKLEVFNNVWNQINLLLLIVPVASFLIMIFYNFKNALTFLCFILLKYGLLFLMFFILYEINFLVKNDLVIFVSMIHFLIFYEMFKRCFWYQNNFKKSQVHFLHWSSLFLIIFWWFLISKDGDVITSFVGLKSIFILCFYLFFIMYPLWKLEIKISSLLEKKLIIHYQNWREKVIKVVPKSGKEEVIKNVNNWS